MDLMRRFMHGAINVNRGVVSMRLIKRYDTQLNAWLIGYWIGTSFIVIDTVKLLEDAKRLYEETA